MLVKCKCYHFLGPLALRLSAEAAILKGESDNELNYWGNGEF